MDEISKAQREFDESHGWFWADQPIEKRIEKMKYLIIALSGELGEIANPFKKFIRKMEKEGFDKKDYLELEEKLKEEVTDIFIYTIMFSHLLGIDLKKEYFKKQAKNKEKYKKYEK